MSSVIESITDEVIGKDISQVLVVIRQSQSRRSESTSLSIQREELPELASEYGEEVIELDLGVHTGFSIHFKPEDEERIDSNSDVLRELSNVRAGVYDYIIAWDDTRLARDPFFWEWVRAAREGNADLVFREDVPDIDSLEFRVRRVVEQDVKKREIQKSKQALDSREEKGYDQGRPPKGLKYDKEGEHWVPDSEFSDVIDLIELREENYTYTDLEEEFGYSRATISKIINEKKDLYLDLAEEYNYV